MSLWPRPRPTFRPDKVRPNFTRLWITSLGSARRLQEQPNTVPLKAAERSAALLGRDVTDLQGCLVRLVKQDMRLFHKMESRFPFSGIFGHDRGPMIIVGTDIVERYFAARAGHRGIKAARAQYDAWRAIVERAQWKRPQDVKKAHPKASVLKGSRVVFNIKGNDYRLIAVVQYANGVLLIRFFGSHEEYDKVDAETM